MILYESTETAFLSNGIAVLTQHVFDDLVTEELNGVFKLEFTYPMFAPNAKDLIFDRIIRASTPQGDEPFFIAKTINKDGYLSVTCYHLFYRNTWNFIEDINIVGLGGQAALARVLEGTGYTGIANTTKTANIRIVRYNVVEAIMGNQDNTILSRIGGELERTKFTVNLRQRRGRTYSQNPVEIRYAKNLESYEAEIDYTTVATRVMPKGFDGLILPEKYVVRPGATAPYKTIMRDYETIKAVADLEDPKEDELPLADAYAAMRQAVLDDFVAGTFDARVNYKVRFVELSSTEEYKNKAVLERLYLGDDVRVIHDDEDIDLIARVISYKWKPLTSEYEQIELGNFQQKFTDIQTKIDTIGGKLEEVASRESLTIEHVTNLLTNALGGYVKQINGEMMIMDTEDPGTATKVWRWNLNGLGYSSTGVNGPYETAITMDGTILGNFIQANSITTNQLSSDFGQNLDLSSNESINLIIKDIQVGGENLIRGSQALADKFEVYQGSTFTTVSDNMTVSEWDTTTATQVRTTSLGTSDLKARWVISNDLAFLADKEMSFSIYAKNNRDNVAVTIGTNRIGEPITLSPLEMKRLEYIGVPAGNEGKLLILELRAPTDGHYVDVTLFHPQWELGNIITDWSPHPDEFITGSTTITGRGVNVSNNVDDTNTDITPSGMVVKDNLTNKPILEAIDTGVMAPLVRAEEVYAPNLINSTTGDINLYVAATATGDGSGRDASNKADSIYTALNVGLKGAKYLFDESTIKINVSGSITEDVYLGGYVGGGEMIIDGGGTAVLKGAVYAENCSIEVTITGFKHYKMDTASDSTLYMAENSTNLYVIQNTIIGNGTGHCFTAWRNGGIHSESNDIVDFVQTYRAWTNSIVSSDGDRGSRAGLNGYIAYAGYGGRVALAITRPLSGTPGSISGTASGGSVDVADATGLASAFNPDVAPPAPTYSNQTKTFYATRKRENRSQNNWFTDNEFGQGVSPSNGTSYRGHAYLYGAIRNWLLGSGGYQGTPSIRMRAKRGAVWGLDSSPPALKLTTPYTITTSTATRGSITPWVTLSSSARDAIIAGNDHFNTTTASSSDYSSWDWIQFEVTASKR